MTCDDLILLIPEANSPIDVVGKAFFSSEVGESDKKLFIEYLLTNKRYYQLSDIMTCRTLSQASSGSDFIKQKTAEANSMDGRYFEVMLLVCRELNVDEKELIPMFFTTATALGGTLLRGFFASVKAYLLRLAYDDYDLVLDYILTYDIKYSFLDVLIAVDRPKTISVLVDMAINRKNINKDELVMFLRNFKNDVLNDIKGKYSSLKMLARESAIALLVMFKNDYLVGSYLKELEASEKSLIIKRLIRDDTSHDDGGIEVVGALGYFYNCMVSGTDFTIKEFTDELQISEYEHIASGLFFSVYYNDLFAMIIIVDGGKICNLDNEQIELEAGAVIRVMHPCELSEKYYYLKNLKIAQPFSQLHRTVYSLDDNKSESVYKKVKGTLITVCDLANNIKRYGFKALNKNSYGLTSEIGIIRDGILCVLKIQPTEIDERSNNLVMAENVAFYSMQDAIKLNGQIYVDGVPFYPITNFTPRFFSEFIYSIYELLGCNGG